jgi:hypothetical protein
MAAREERIFSCGRTVLPGGSKSIARDLVGPEGRLAILRKISGFPEVPQPAGWQTARIDEKAVETRKGIIDRAAYRLIWSCLHDDSRKSVSSEKLNKSCGCDGWF